MQARWCQLRQAYPPMYTRGVWCVGSAPRGESRGRDAQQRRLAHDQRSRGTKREPESGGERLDQLPRAQRWRVEQAGLLRRGDERALERGVERACQRVGRLAQPARLGSRACGGRGEGSDTRRQGQVAAAGSAVRPPARQNASSRDQAHAARCMAHVRGARAACCAPLGGAAAECRGRARGARCAHLAGSRSISMWLRVSSSATSASCMPSAAACAPMRSSRRCGGRRMACGAAVTRWRDACSDSAPRL